MQLCFLHKFPLLAVKIFFHIRKYKLDISPITYSFYNKALIETDNWPTFDQDKWGKFRLIWLVVCKFRQNLKIKTERELKAKAKKENKLKRKKSKKNLKNSKPQVIADKNRANFRQNKLDMRNLDKKPENPILKSQKIDKKYNSVFLLNSAGLIFSEQKLQDNINSNRKFLSFSNDLDKLNLKISFENEISHLSDPLGALLSDSIKEKGSTKLSSQNEDVKKRLFDYKPFENKKNIDSHCNQDISYDSDLQSDDNYDGSSEQDLNSDKSIDFESGSDFEVDSDHFNLKNRQESDKLSQSKISSDSRNSCITPKQNSNNGFVNPRLTPFFSGFMKKLENSIELSGSKLKTACQLVQDKSMEFKDALISSSSQNEIASTVRSLSSYNIKTKQYINQFVKSTSNFSMKKNSANESLNKNDDRNDRVNGFEKMHVLFNLEPLITDEQFESKSLAWWKINPKLNHLCDSKAKKRLLDVQMSTCN